MSNYGVETVNAQFLNQAFVDKLDAGLDKQAAASMSTFVRMKLREEGFTRKIFTPQPITSADLDRDLVDQPRIIVEKEPDSIAAAIPLTAQGEINYFNGKRYEVNFYKIESPTFKKSKFELATYKTDIRQILQDNSVKDIQKVEDGNFVSALKAIAADTNSGNPGAQDLNGFGIQPLISLISTLVQQEQKCGKILMPHNLYLKLLSRKHSVVGSVAAENFRGGPMNSFFGFEIITTNKYSIMNYAANGDMVIAFAPENYLGQFYSLQDPTVFLKAEADMVEFKTYESVGIGIGNTKAFTIGYFDLAAADVD